MVIGEYKQKVGEKNRIALPKSFREELGDLIIITKGYEGCLVLMSPSQWEGMIESEISGPFVSGAIRDTTRFLLGSASELALDSQGRFVIPQYLVEYSNISSEGVFLGLGRWVELWDKTTWDHKSKEIEGNSSLISEKLADIKPY